jgi:hypothetical protein
VPGKHEAIFEYPKGIAGNNNGVSSGRCLCSVSIAVFAASVEVNKSVPTGRCGPCSSKGLIGM